MTSLHHNLTDSRNQNTSRDEVGSRQRAFHSCATVICSPWALAHLQRFCYENYDMMISLVATTQIPTLSIWTIGIQT